MAEVDHNNLLPLQCILMSDNIERQRGRCQAEKLGMLFIQLRQGILHIAFLNQK